MCWHAGRTVGIYPRCQPLSGLLIRSPVDCNKPLHTGTHEQWDDRTRASLPGPWQLRGGTESTEWDFLYRTYLSCTGEEWELKMSWRTSSKSIDMVSIIPSGSFCHVPSRCPSSNFSFHWIHTPHSFMSLLGLLWPMVANECVSGSSLSCKCHLWPQWLAQKQFLEVSQLHSLPGYLKFYVSFLHILSFAFGTYGNFWICDLLRDK